MAEPTVEPKASSFPEEEGSTANRTILPPHEPELIVPNPTHLTSDTIHAAGADITLPPDSTNAGLAAPENPTPTPSEDADTDYDFKKELTKNPDLVFKK